MARLIHIFPTALVAAASLTRAQMPPPPLSSVEPGLEKAVRWKWHPEPSSLADWGLHIRIEQPASVPGSSTTVPIHHDETGRPNSYVVRKGDALAIIGRKFKVPVDLLKQVNGLTSNLIRVGDVLRIPTPEEVAAHSPPPVTPKPAGPAVPGLDDAQQADTLTLQVYLDRAQFSGGPIDGQITPAFLETIQVFAGAHPEFKDSNALLETARQAVQKPLVRYALRPQDFRFIAPPKAQLVDPKSKKKPSTETPRPTYEDLIAAQMLAYRSPWEFVAERFHCNEKFLRQLNPGIKGIPAAGAEFWVPNVAPFEIERALVGTIQPLANAGIPVTASIVGLTRLEIRQADKLVAALPISIARPGLRGKDSWTILNAIPRPELVTNQESRYKPQPQTRIYGRESPTAATPAPTPVPQKLVLAPGPRNPVGVIWINLAKTPDSEPLSFGLHGTSIPDEMSTHESLGGIRMANWDISRATRLLPPGTPLVWAESTPATAAPAPPL